MLLGEQLTGIETPITGVEEDMDNLTKTSSWGNIWEDDEEEEQ